MPQDVKVELGDRSYAIGIGTGLLDGVGAVCADLGLGTNGLIVSDSNVDPLYGQRCEDSLKDAGIEVCRAVVPAGESSKSGDCLFELYEVALEHGVDRQAFIVALGGGVVGDLAGYMAATFLRGIQLVQVPTSLLAMVDSSVGGKTGINLPQGKNLVGAFYQPRGVVADLSTLETLPRREYISGLAEVVKYGVIQDADLFSLLEKKSAALLDMDLETLEIVVARCCEIKAEVVETDEREGGLRAILNFGHTLGHALEQVTGYTEYLHGEAVSIGMAYAARLSVEQQGLPQDECDRMVALLQKLELPTDVKGVEWKALRAAMDVDKKVKAGEPRFVLAKHVGSVMHGIEVSDAALEEAWGRR